LWQKKEAIRSEEEELQKAIAEEEERKRDEIGREVPVRRPWAYVEAPRGTRRPYRFIAESIKRGQEGRLCRGVTCAESRRPSAPGFHPPAASALGSFPSVALPSGRTK